MQPSLVALNSIAFDLCFDVFLFSLKHLFIQGSTKKKKKKNGVRLNKMYRLGKLDALFCSGNELVLSSGRAKIKQA